MKKLTTKKLTDSAAAIIANSKSTLSTQEELAGGYSNFVLDMLHLKTPDVKVTGPGKAVGPDYIDRTSARSLQKALSAASKASPITSLVVTHPLGKTGKGGIRIPYAVTVTKETDPGATEHYATFTLKIEPLTIPSCKTVIKVIFSRDVAEGASKYQIAVQANPTSPFGNPMAAAAKTGTRNTSCKRRVNRSCGYWNAIRKTFSLPSMRFD